MEPPEHHETLAPSSFNALQHCAHYLSSGAETPESQRGTRIHAVTAEMLARPSRARRWRPAGSRRTDELQACQLALSKMTQQELPEILASRSGWRSGTPSPGS